MYFSGMCILGLNAERPTPNATDMFLKSILLTSVILLSYLLSFSQSGFPYDHEWKITDSLMNIKNLPKSALEEVNKVYAAAKKDRQEAQWVKAIIYKNHLQGVEDRDITQSMKELEDEISTAPPRVAALLKSIEAENLYQYLLANGYEMRNRTAIISDTSTDISAWTTIRFNMKIRSLYLSSLNNSPLLQQTPIDRLDPILMKGNARELRPTLFDLLSWRALDYFRIDEPVNLNVKDDKLMENIALFSEAPFFMHFGFSKTDSAANNLLAVRIYQQLLRFHAKDIPLDAWIDADISRIQFAYQYAQMPGKDSLYLNALERITSQFPSLSASTQSWYLQAKWWANQASSYEPLKDTSHRFDYLEAIVLCDQAVKYPDSSEGKSNCIGLLKDINHKYFNLTIEDVNIPEQPFRALVTYRNVNYIFGRIIKIDDATRKSLDQTGPYEKYWQQLTRMPAGKTFLQKIPDTKDYQQHLVEIKIDGLPAGQYVLLTSSDSAFNDKSIMSAAIFYCSSISFVRNGFDYFVVDRDSGHPLKGVKIRSFIRKNDESTYSNIQSESFLSDINGHFKLALSERQRNASAIKLEFSLGKDFFSSDQYIRYYRSGRSYDDEDDEEDNSKEFEEDHLRDNLYTDRSIYRPGQTVFFKGILVTKDFKTRKYKPVIGKKTTIFLKDVNDQMIDSVILKSNDFGSIHGSFHLPQNLLSGKFKLYDGETIEDKEFSVEEYKRPTFYVEFDSVGKPYAMGDTIKIKGSATAYAGNSVGGAKLTWNVTRESRILYPWLFNYFPSNSSMEIASGETQTDADGKFIVVFPALADPSINRGAGAVYSYLIETTVTDINGETRSATTTISASYNSFEIISSLELQSRLYSDSLQRIPVITRNAAGIFICEKLSVSLSPLENPLRLIRKRYWQQPDEFVMSEAEYVKSFPNDEYRNELDMKSWKQGPMIFEKADSTNSTGIIYLGKNLLTSLKPGWYVLEFRAKDYGELITDKRYIEIIGNSTKSASYSYNIIPDEDIPAEPGSQIHISTGSDASSLFIIRAKQELVDSMTYFSFYTLNQEIKQFNIEINESDRGGFALNDIFVKNNRWYTSEHDIRVPWTNKELQISYLSWHDKMLPGSKEQWKVKISGYKKDKVIAEMLTSVYDASLDQIEQQSWIVPDLYPLYRRFNEWNNGFSDLNFSKVYSHVHSDIETPALTVYHQTYDQLLAFRSGNKMRMLQGSVSGIEVYNRSENLNDMVVAGYGALKTKKQLTKPDYPKFGKEELKENSTGDNIQIRKNFNETAFFKPDLKTDAQGNVEINFTMPDALTKWKWMVLANTKDLSFGYAEKFVVTQKELMVQTNMPRFFREGDTMLLPVKIANLSSEVISGTAHLEWLDASNNQNADQALGNITTSKPFSVNAVQSGIVFFPAIIPAHFNRPLLYRITARTNMKGAEYSDGEENIIPVLSNRMLVTESLPLNMEGKEEKHFIFEKLLKSKESTSLQNQLLTVEYTTNPAWYAIQSLPYLMEFPYECAEQTFNRFYANALASLIIHFSPAMVVIFEKWKNTDTAALLSNLQKNEELKSILLRETPWVLQAQTETQQKRNLALLFDMIGMRAALKSALDKLQQMQSEDGGFAWFKGGRDDRYITQYIISGIGRLRKLKAIPPDLKNVLNKMASSGIAFLDKEINSDYERRDKSPVNQNLDPIQIQYLYMRSFFPEMDIPGDLLKAMNYYRKISAEKWTKESAFMQGMIAVFLNRTGDIKTAKDILASLKENASSSPELGMFWKSVNNGFYWQEAPVETQSLLIEAFQELHADQNAIDRMKYWLLQQKRSSHWPTTKATADACYALLLSGSDWLASQQTVSIQLGNYEINSNEEKTEAGAGYFKKQIPGDQILPDMGNIQVSLSQKSESAPNAQRPAPNTQRSSVIGQPSSINPSWGAIYWQYFEDLDKITTAQTQLSIRKNLFIEKNSDKGPVLEAISEKNILRPGDKLKMRIIIKTDRDLEYVHLKDMRAACLEPVNVLSGYEWQDGLGYYQTTKDASTSFFFDRLPKGTFVFEYPVFVTTAGNYSNGLSILECMYAPEFAAHSEGVRLHVESK
jgi:Bacterial Alpha-2-macroglobulin MG10 domain/Alpha-2-macroglobulin family/MG2 domain